MNFTASPEWNELQAASGGKTQMFIAYRLGAAKVVISDPRWNQPAAPWTDRDRAMLFHRYYQLMDAAFTTDAGRDPACCYGAIVDFARSHPDYQVWIEGELIR